jgi:ATP-binding dynein motor region
MYSVRLSHQCMQKITDVAHFTLHTLLCICALQQVTIVNFTLTESQWSERLLTTVIHKEQRILDHQFTDLHADTVTATSAAVTLSETLISQLSNTATTTSSSLIDDDALIAALTETHAAVLEAAERLETVATVHAALADKARPYRITATRGAVLHSLAVEVTRLYTVNSTASGNSGSSSDSGVSHAALYSIDAAQFEAVFERGLASTDKAALGTRHISSAVAAVTLCVYKHLVSDVL